MARNSTWGIRVPQAIRLLALRITMLSTRRLQAKGQMILSAVMFPGIFAVNVPLVPQNPTAA